MSYPRLEVEEEESEEEEEPEEPDERRRVGVLSHSDIGSHRPISQMLKDAQADDRMGNLQDEMVISSQRLRQKGREVDPESLPRSP